MRNCGNCDSIMALANHGKRKENKREKWIKQENGRGAEKNLKVNKAAVLSLPGARL